MALGLIIYGLEHCFNLLFLSNPWKNLLLKTTLDEQQGGIDMFLFDPGGLKAIFHRQDGLV